MACLSVFMQGSSSPRVYPFHYMDSTITTYLSVCKLVLSDSIVIVRPRVMTTPFPRPFRWKVLEFYKRKLSVSGN